MSCRVPPCTVLETGFESSSLQHMCPVAMATLDLFTCYSSTTFDICSILTIPANPSKHSSNWKRCCSRSPKYIPKHEFFHSLEVDLVRLPIRSFSRLATSTILTLGPGTLEISSLQPNHIQSSRPLMVPVEGQRLPTSGSFTMENHHLQKCLGRGYVIVLRRVNFNKHENL